ncbi:molybdenum ABC transporter ATP-binding protein [Psychromonas aquatilis]|uniref:Molybdenum ABC transporter ATP-binding protein n=1 Tax=Psychromonas aquatilis TaxID=2005072 RepID=A0ABU9GNJ0_9GAMM
MLKFDVIKKFKHSRKELHFQGEIKLSGVCAIFGDSGAGKTTLLRCLLGLEPCFGDININQQAWLTGDKCLVPAERRRIGVVFQEPRLFPHLNVQQNLQLAVNKSNQSVFTINKLAKDLGFESLLTQQTTQLSGGQKQRIAIARALLINPQLLVMDEPLSSLDKSSKKKLLPFLKKISETIPILYVTHSEHELFYLSKQMILIHEGAVEAIGQPHQLFLDSQLSLIKFAQQGLILNVQVNRFDSQEALIEGDVDGQPLYVSAEHPPLGDSIQVKINSRDVIVAMKPIQESSLLNCLLTEVVDYREEPEAVVLTLKLQQQFIYAYITLRSFNNLNLSIGSQVYAHVKTMSIIN